MIKATIDGKIIFSPDFQRKPDKENIELEHAKKAYELAKIAYKHGTIKAVELRIYRENIEKLKVKKSYDRNNNITNNGTSLNGGARSQIHRLCHWLYRNNHNKLHWITFTLGSANETYNSLEKDTFGNPAMVKRELLGYDSYYIQAYSRLLENLVTNYGLKDYIWVAEKQNTNGRGAIHFHCVFEFKKDYIEYKTLRRLWNNLISDYHQWSHRSVFGKTLNDVKHLSMYLAKYISKDTGKEQDKVFGRRWACTHDWSRISRDSRTMVKIDHDTANSVLEIAENIKHRIKFAISEKNTNITIEIFWLDPDCIQFLFLQNQKKESHVYSKADYSPSQ